MIKGAIFDIDGTLIDSMPIWNDLGAIYLRNKGITPEPHLIDKLFPMTVKEGVAYLKSHYHLPESEGEIQQGLNEISEHFYKYEVPLKPGAKELIEAYHQKQIPMVLCTVGMPTLAIPALKRLGVYDYFSKIFVCDEFHTTKREPLIYMKAAQYLTLKPDEILVFEDILQAVQTAHQAGFKVCGVYDEASRSDEEDIRRYSDYFVHDFRELLGKDDT